MGDRDVGVTFELEGRSSSTIRRAVISTSSLGIHCCEYDLI